MAGEEEQSKAHVEKLLNGTCYCGGIKFTVLSNESTNIRAYCHCESCRRAHSAPMYQVVYVPENSFNLIEGADLVKAFSRNEESIVRSFCFNCGSRICNRLPLKPELGVGFFPSLLEEEVQHNLPECFRPDYHYLSGEATVDLSKLNDGLPRV